MPIWLPSVLAFMGAVLVALLSVLGSHVVSKRNARSADKAAGADVQGAINEGFGELVEALREELKSARREILALRGELRDTLQHLDSLERLLQTQGVQVPVRARTRPALVIPLEG